MNEKLFEWYTLVISCMLLVCPALYSPVSAPVLLEAMDTVSAKHNTDPTGVSFVLSITNVLVGMSIPEIALRAVPAVCGGQVR